MHKKYLSVFLITVFSSTILLTDSVFADERMVATEVAADINSTDAMDIINTDNFVFTDYAENLFYGKNISLDPAPAKEKIDNAVSVDQKSFLKSFQGKHEVSLFSGALNYYYPIWVPEGRNGMTPQINLAYSSMDTRFTNAAGYGWSMTANGIFRTPRKGIDTMFTSNEFTADIFGNTEELILVDAAKQIYMPKNEGSFTQYTRIGNYWTAVDKRGNKYTFGKNYPAQQSNPINQTNVYKWFLERVEDTNGNFMTFDYWKMGGAVYPYKIRYTGWGANAGIYEVNFTLATKDLYTTYKTGFRADYNRVIDKINIVSYADGTAKTILTYDLDYKIRNTAITLLDKITVNSGNESLPPVKFEYYDGTETGDGEKMNGLKKALGAFGSTETFVYKPSTAYRKATGESENMLPFVVHTISEYKVKTDASSTEYTIKYDYKNGLYYYNNLDAYKREYAGFGKVSVTDPKGNVRKIYFHQSEFDKNNASDAKIGEFMDHISKKGRIYRDEIYDNANTIRKQVLTTWNKSAMPDADPNNERLFVYLQRTSDFDYGENKQSMVKAVTYEYDAYGNVKKETDYGRVLNVNSMGDFGDFGIDKVTTVTTYAYNTAKGILGMPSRTEKTDYYGNLIGMGKIYYDGLALWQVNKGNETKHENYYSQPGFVKTESAYNAYGLVTDMTNPRGYKTTTIYDSFNLYPASVTNAKGHITKYEYNYGFGVMAKTTDPNNAITETVLDALGRIKEIKVKDGLGQMKTVKKYEYNLAGFPVSVTEKTYPDNTDTNSNVIEIISKTYFDGLGRAIQTKKEIEGASAYAMSNISYDERGYVKKEYLPKSSATLNFETINISDYGNEYDYDVMGRVKKIINPNGTTQFYYHNWWKSITDANGKTTQHYYDARGNLTQVNEKYNGKLYPTYYAYDANNNLTKITDAEGNIKQSAYDLFSRKTSQELLHKPGVTDIKKYVYTYDENGNVKTKKDAIGQVITYAYDELDRVIKENTGMAGEESLYIYDTSVNGKGRLASVTFKGGSSAYNYDIQGNIADETKTANGKTWKTSYTYDIAGNMKKITYTDNKAVNYVYNNAGVIETVTGYIKDVNYSPAGMPLMVKFGNGAVTTDTYDISKMYRLVSRKTVAGGKNVQDIAYTYDAVGNVKKIIDASDTNAAKTAVYTYDDLHRLVSAAVTGTKNKKDYTETYSYGITGNILYKSDVGNYEYSGWHPQAASKMGATSYLYNKNGSVTAKGAWQYAYDTRGRMVKADKSGVAVAGSATYSYNEWKKKL